MCFASMAWRASLARNLKEIRVLCCPQSKASNGARQFFETEYRELKMLNPSLPIMIRYGDQVEAQVLGQYGRGVERVLSIEGMSPTEIEEQVKDLSMGQAAKEALLHEEWRGLLDTNPSFGLFMQLNGEAGLWDKVKQQDFLGIFDPANNRRGISEEQKALLSAWDALGSDDLSQYASGGLRAFCKEHAAADAARGALFAQWKALPSSEQAAYEAQHARSEGMRYFAVAAADDLKKRRRVAGEPADAEERYLAEMYDALPAAERTEFETRALSGDKMQEYEELPPPWEQ